MQISRSKLDFKIIKHLHLAKSLVFRLENWSICYYVIINLYEFATSLKF